ncbi:uncharacterized protein LY79DRAFT_566614 [Colletotrichum navitas]|uniref:Uncharacterized protein n=1 Tax=Colletotrichum navitas TaxID=681940 RepID=A0AAD8V1A5_9PEZI|nr:uncharacterized protein LY79DRAFT_566614 [Colletotrichum navitas]KAK1574170.1 hypothetical protein LY79DRAFT_566614 [Colletotrichum navitas]
MTGCCTWHHVFGTKPTQSHSYITLHQLPRASKLMQLFLLAFVLPRILAAMGEKFIVEFGSSKDEERKAMISELTADERTKVVKQFDHAVFSGVVIETGNHNLDTLRALPNVGNVWPSKNEGLLGALGGPQS